MPDPAYDRARDPLASILPPLPAGSPLYSAGAGAQSAAAGAPHDRYARSPAPQHYPPPGPGYHAAPHAHPHAGPSYAPVAPPAPPGRAPMSAPAHIPSARGAAIEAIPAPAVKEAYAPPVFRTFQDRRREKDAALHRAASSASLATAGSSSGPSTPAPEAGPPMLPHATAPVPTSSAVPEAKAYGQPGGTVPQHGGRLVHDSGRRSPAPGAATTAAAGGPPPVRPFIAPLAPFAPSPAALAMLGQASGRPPAPPPRSRTSAVPPSPTHPVHPTAPPRSQTTPAYPSSPVQVAGLAAMQMTPPSTASPTKAGRALPPAPAVPFGPPSTPGRARSPQPTPRHASPGPSTAIGPPPVPALGSPRPVLPPLSAAQAEQVALERSDTISSVKSLDRPTFSASSRPLPRPPVGVNASRSLDRGVPSPTATGMCGVTGAGAIMRRKQPSVVREESEDGPDDMAALSIGGSRPHSPTKGTEATPVTPSPVPSFTVSSASSATSPAVATPAPACEVSVGTVPVAPGIVAPDDGAAKTPSMPAISVPSFSFDDADDPDPGSAGITFGGVPTIAVSSSDTSDEPGPLSIAVPTIAGSSSTTSHGSHSQAAPERIEATSAIVCAGCDNAIIGRIVSAMGRRWHPQCFRCDGCGELLEHVSSYEHDGKAYCHLDYHDRFAHRCHHCKTPIVEPRFITLEDAVLGQRFYHELHFFCSECGDPFLDPSRSSAPGTEQSRSRPDLAAAAAGQGVPDDAEDGDDETSAFVIHKGHPYCERCHVRLHKPKCAKCRLPIPDVALDAMGAKWHAECFVCTPFANSLFFPKDGAAFCTTCYTDFDD